MFSLCVLGVYCLSYLFALYGDPRNMFSYAQDGGSADVRQPDYALEGKWVEVVFLPIHLVDRMLFHDEWYRRSDPQHDDTSSVEMMQGL